MKTVSQAEIDSNCVTRENLTEAQLGTLINMLAAAWGRDKGIKISFIGPNREECVITKLNWG